MGGIETPRRWVLNEAPSGLPDDNTFRLDSFDPGALEDGEVLVAVRYISIDPGMRSRLSGDSYSAAMAPGEVIESAGLGEVIDSKNEKYAVGDWVMGATGWTSHVKGKPRGLVKIQKEIFQGPLTITAAIGVLGIPGLTAYFGLKDLGSPKEGETVLVSSAAGTVGATTGQIAKMMGLNAVGIAGGADKCGYLKEIGFDGVIDYKAESDLRKAIRTACPDGVDIYLDNVGGEMLDAAISNMNERGRLVISGAVSEYNRDKPVGIRNTLDFISKRLRMEGLVVFDYAADFQKAQMEMAGWIMEGKLSYREIITDGLENAPAAFGDLFNGADVYGRRIVKVS